MAMPPAMNMPTGSPVYVYGMDASMRSTITRSADINSGCARMIHSRFQQTREAGRIEASFLCELGK